MLGFKNIVEEASYDVGPLASKLGPPRAARPAWNRGALRLFRLMAHAAFASALLLFLLPIMAVIAAAVAATSRGPILFKQRRVGENGQEFWLYKFRSMVVDAEARRVHLNSLNEASGPIFKIRNDPRITPVGRILRKFSLDELPQLINVVKGDMCLIGPRPALPAEVAQYTSRQRVRLSAPPGITGLAQVSGRSDLPFEKCVELDLFFIEHWSPALELRIFMRTIAAVLTGRGAY